MAYKSGFVTIIGRPNVGKSTLLNKIVGQKIVITSDKAQTTRERLRGIFTSEKGQIVFVDTPGVHKPLNKLGEFLLEEAKLAVPDADVILFMVDGKEPAGAGDKWIAKNILQTDIPIILVVNKVDTIKNVAERDLNVVTYRELFDNLKIPVVKVSAKTGRNIDTLIKNIYAKLPEGIAMYDEDEVTDQNMREIAKEIIREKILRLTQDEIPHSVAVKVDLFEEKKTLTKISATIFVEQDSQKLIVVGKQGQMIKKIGEYARVELENMIGRKVFLDLFVKVKKNWRKKEDNLKNLGYNK
ncbi:MAG TPA: GTPase Era [Candidatus Adamsella sp.]|nr:GTPase Era [Candidatus Adamsella sp.]